MLCVDKEKDSLAKFFTNKIDGDIIFIPFPFKDDGSIKYKIKLCEVCGKPLNQLLKMPKEEVVNSGKPYKFMKDSDFTDKVILVRAFCDCHEKDKKVDTFNQQKEKQEEFKNSVVNRRKECFDSESYYDLNFNCDKKYDCDVSNYTIDYANNFNEKSKGIVYLGNVGIGKTFYACCIANKLLDQGCSVYFNQMPKMVNVLTKDFGKNQDTFLKFIREVDLLIIDDFGIERSSEYMYENIYLIINERYISKKPMIITTNLSLEEYNHEATKFNRIHSRIKEMCVTKFFNVERDLRCYG